MIHAVPTAYRTPAGTAYKPFLRLAECPHLLIAGATGSGKSVALNGIIHNLLLTKSPFECQLVLIDPKKVELSQYKALPHCAKYADTHPDIVRALQWALEETERRFGRMQNKGIREYDGPHLYVIVDELADLMVSIKNETLPLLQRLAQIGRAARVHCIELLVPLFASQMESTLDPTEPEESVIDAVQSVTHDLYCDMKFDHDMLVEWFTKHGWTEEDRNYFGISQMFDETEEE